MDNKSVSFVAFAAAAIACIAVAGTATAAAPAHKVVGKCVDIQWSADLLKKYPRAPAKCLDVVEKDGKKYARFMAKVVKVKPDAVTIKFLNVAGTPGSPVVITPTADALVNVGDQKLPYAKLKKGEKLTFYVPELTVGVISDPADAAMASILL